MACTSSCTLASHYSKTSGVDGGARKSLERRCANASASRSALTPAPSAAACSSTSPIGGKRGVNEGSGGNGGIDSSGGGGGSADNDGAALPGPGPDPAAASGALPALPLPPSVKS